ncbi:MULTISPECIES: relaxase/mobilization nuclease domain-containing protein [unclassified Streptomyces]|uniref:relaxase/mobilization nuclease domain-containing protein n=1 Tax=unclassified Streptomyces TaxID=2593676 RepID=UPI001BE84862|nr:MULTISPECIES: relaxase/mobilization nuclease domain-containing protein [unclassified Streptomyces]MBT2402094.1 mobilization protein [Streptomyces sp. ISL-21]MBT2607593.1 mobilization protein [Streptomyces sp. ISL-87]
MIPSIHKQGGDTAGLIAYLYGPGLSEEHVDPHLVASFDGLAPDPGRDPRATRADLQQLLDEPLHLLPADTRPDKHVWHASVRSAPGDRILTDDEWADIARRVIAATGIDPGDGAGCRWAAIRHADDHIHLITTLVREDGRKPDHHRSGKRAQTECRRIEADYDLYRVAPGDGTAAKRPTCAERHKAQRQGRDRTAREELRETVRRAAAGTASETEFFDRLASAGLMVCRRTAPSGDTLGYTVALPEDRNKDGAPVHYSGSKLAPDLSLPRLRERWTGSPTQPSPAQASRPASTRRRATTAVWQAVLLIDHSDDGTVAAQLAAAGEVLDALAKTSAAHTRHKLRKAATAFERVARSHVRAERGQNQVLRQAARDLVHGGPALGRGEDGATTAMLIDMAFFLATAASAWHAKKGHAQQAVAALQAAEYLRVAYQAAAAQPMALLQERGRHMFRPLQHQHAAALRHAVPDLAEQVLAEPGWPALAATLADAQAAGHNPTDLLTEATQRRELGSATSISDVLVWRLRHLAQLPANPVDAHSPIARHRVPTPPSITQTAVKDTGEKTRRR